MSDKFLQREDALKSALAAMEAVGLPMEKFVSFVEPKVETPVLLFSNSLRPKLSDLAPQSDISPAPNKQQKVTT